MTRTILILATLCIPATLLAQKPSAPRFTSASVTTSSTKIERVNAIKPPKNPLPAESVSEGISRFSFLVYGDTRGRRDGKEVQYEHSLVVDSMLSTIKKEATNGFPVRFILQTGDAVVDGRDPKQWNKSFIDLISRLTGEGGVPYFLAPGNHDVTSAKELNSTNRLKGLTNYLEAMSQLIPPDGASRRLEHYPTYAFGYGNSFFIALDSNIAGDKTQLQWVKGQLEGLDRNRYQNIFAFCHHPPFSSGSHGGAKIEEPAADMRKNYLPLFRKHHVRVLFSGHEHLFEHWVEKYQDKDGHKYRLDQIVTGGGGAPLYSYQGEPNTTPYTDAGKPEKVELTHLVKPGYEPGNNPYHYLLVRVDGAELSIQVTGIDWGSGFAPYRSSKTELTSPR